MNLSSLGVGSPQSLRVPAKRVFTFKGEIATTRKTSIERGNLALQTEEEDLISNGSSSVDRTAKHEDSFHIRDHRFTTDSNVP